MLYNPRPGHQRIPLKGDNPTPPNFIARVMALINSVINSKEIVQGTSGGFSSAGPLPPTVLITITIPTQTTANYKVFITPTSLAVAVPYYVTNKTTTSFDVVYPAPIAGTVTFDWLVVQ